MMENTSLQTLITFDGALPVMRPLAKALGLKNVIITKVTDYIQGMPVSTAKSLELDEGWRNHAVIYWNEQPIGRYAKCGPDRRFYIPEGLLRAENTLAIELDIGFSLSNGANPAPLTKYSHPR